MRCITRRFSQTGYDFNLSPEQWLSAETASQMTGAVLFGAIVQPQSQVSIPPENARYVLDTGHARDGLLDLPILGNEVAGRTSAKKLARAGDVIISRLRPYLRQVAYIPGNVSSILGQETFYCSTEFFVLRRKDGANAAGLVAWLLSEPVQEMIGQAATGGHHPRINIDLLLGAPIDERYLDPIFSESIGRVLTRHLQGQRELLVLLRHDPGAGVVALGGESTTAVSKKFL